jgi:hypothetical protein
MEIGSFKNFYGDRLAARNNKMVGQASGPLLKRRELGRQDTPATRTRQQQPGGLTTSTHLVPAAHRQDTSVPREVDKLRGQPRGIVQGDILPQSRLLKIMNDYGIKDLDKKHPKQLGNSNEYIQFDPRINSYRLNRS